MVKWNHRLNRHEFGQTLGHTEGWGSLECCSPRGCKELDMTEQLDNNKNKHCSMELNLRVVLGTSGFAFDIRSEGGLGDYSQTCHECLSLLFLLCSKTRVSLFLLSSLP